MSSIPPVSSDSFGNYLKTISKYKILPDEEVIELTRKIKAYIDIRDKLAEREDLTILSEQCDYLGISEEEFKRIDSVHRAAKQKLIMHNIRFVAHIAKRYQAYGVSIEDLVQEGTIGLNRAAELFKPEKGYKFTTYAFWWIRQAITKYLNLSSKSIKMPPDIQIVLKRIKEVKQETLTLYGRQPSIEEIAKKLNKSQNRIYQSLNCTKEFISVDLIEDYSNLDSDDDKQVSYYGDALTPELLSNLTEIQRYIIIKKFGLDGEKPMTYKNISKVLNCSPQHILKEKTKAFDKLKELCA